MDDKQFMLLAIEGAKKSREELKCGAVIVKEGRVIASCHNKAYELHDASAHAEINAIGEAGQKLKSKRLEGSVIYCTCEPCVMCLAAIAYVRIGRLVYGLILRLVSPKEKIIDVDLDYFLRKSPNKIEIVRKFMEEECKQLLR